MKIATIQDVAELAGVSTKTVSRVLNHEPKVRESTRQNIESAIKRLNYQPNSSARKLAGRRTYLLGLVYNANSSFISGIQNGVLEACRGQHYDLLINPCLSTGSALLRQLKALVAPPRVDGLILLPPISDRPEVRALMRKLDVPNVAISRESVSDSNWTVCTNDRDISEAMTKYLADLGHKRIAFVKGHPDHKAMTNRYKGYLDGMRAAGLKVPKSLVIDGLNTFDSGQAGGLRLLRRKFRPTAIYCANDHMAAGVMNVIHNTGLSIPGDISVAGFDDLPLASQIWPQLTTVRQPLNEIAKLAGELLIKRVRGVPPGDVNRIIDAELTVRASTGPVKGNSK